jgi:hypothetical protein
LRPDYAGTDNYTDKIYLSFGADEHVEGRERKMNQGYKKAGDQSRAQAGRLPDPPSGHGKSACAVLLDSAVSHPAWRRDAF